MNNQTNEKDLQKEQKKEKRPWSEAQRQFVIIILLIATILTISFVGIRCYFYSPQQYANVAYNQTGESGTQTTANVGR